MRGGREGRCETNGQQNCMTSKIDNDVIVAVYCTRSPSSLGSRAGTSCRERGLLHPWPFNLKLGVRWTIMTGLLMNATSIGSSDGNIGTRRRRGVDSCWEGGGDPLLVLLPSFLASGWGAPIQLLDDHDHYIAVTPCRLSISWQLGSKSIDRPTPVQ